MSKVMNVKWLNCFLDEVGQLARAYDRSCQDKSMFTMKKAHKLYGIIESARWLGYLNDSTSRKLLAIVDDPSLHLKLGIELVKEIQMVFPQFEIKRHIGLIFFVKKRK